MAYELIDVRTEAGKVGIIQLIAPSSSTPSMAT